MPLRQDLLNPIPGDNPSGQNLRYTPVYEKIKEARREDADVPQGDWQFVRKVASWNDVIKLASDALATQSKDLQLAVWLSEALLRREGIKPFSQSLTFMLHLMEQFWDTLYPELEDGDAELRAAPLDWLANRMDEPLRQISLTQSGLTFITFKQSRAMGFEADSVSDVKRLLRRQMIDEGKTTPEEFDEAALATPATFYQTLKADVDECLSAIEKLNAYCNEAFGDFAPSFSRCRSVVEEIDQTVRTLLNKKGVLPQAPAPPQPEPAEIAPPSTPVQVESAPAASVQPPRTEAPAPRPAEPASFSLEPADKEDAAARIASVAKWLRRKDCYDIAPFLMLRGLRWGELRYNGERIDEGMLEAPSSEIRVELARLHKEQKWEELIESAEQAMALPCGRGWLDLQRYVVNALVERGNWFSEVAKAIRTELRGLLTDLPMLLGMSLADGTPVAGIETSNWIRSEVMDGGLVAERVPAEPEAPAAANPGLHAAPPPNLGGNNFRTDEVFDGALELAHSGQLTRAIGAISEQLARERSGRGRFQRRMQLAHLFMAAGKSQIARPILDDLAGELDRRNLEEWEDGEAIAYPLHLLYRCLSEIDGESDRRCAIYSRLCRIAPARALEMEF
jgi:type VI secretion system protein ImpA